ncbi:DUF3987 domain-containing protein [Loktanella salsilacus]|jgi:hypothetical protein|nr:DUF3987 domain-containing protein [Loktanella salsilacus]
MQKSARESGDSAVGADWLKPAAEATGDAPDVGVPAETLRSTYTDWAEQRAQAGGTFLAVLLGKCGAAIGNARVATAGPGTWFLAVLWIMTVGTSGAAKSPAIWAVVDLYEKLEQRLRAAHGDDRDLTERERAEIAADDAQHQRILAATGTNDANTSAPASSSQPT